MQTQRYISWVELINEVLKVAVVLSITFTSCYLMITVDWVNLLEESMLPHIIAILLAFFSMGLSAWFYFKASDVSNAFYDRSFIFTKEISETLGRMEERFSEKLESLASNYSKIESKFPLIYGIQDGIKESAEILNKDELTENERNELKNQLEYTNKKLLMLMNDLKNTSATSNYSRSPIHDPRFRMLVSKFIRVSGHEVLQLNTDDESDRTKITYLFGSFLINEGIAEWAQENNFIDRNYMLTPLALFYVLDRINLEPKG